LARLKQFQERLLTARQAEPTPQPVAAEEEEDKGDAWFVILKFVQVKILFHLLFWICQAWTHFEV